MSPQNLSKQTQKNWWINAGLFLSAVIAAISGIYFLFLPVGGFQGGRNPLYNVQILFTRHTWDDIHTWSGIAIIAAALVHFAIHWPWVTSMARRTWAGLTGKGIKLNLRGRWNLILNTVVALGFLLTALSGVYFLFVPGGRGAVDPMFLFARYTWDMIHTWAGVAFIATGIVHLAIHWKWVTKVSRKMFGMALPSQPEPQLVPVRTK
jgi:hypothetical protein